MVLLGRNRDRLASVAAACAAKGAQVRRVMPEERRGERACLTQTDTATIDVLDRDGFTTWLGAAMPRHARALDGLCWRRRCV